MKRFIGVIIMLSIVLMSCNSSIVDDAINTTTWKRIVNNEWRNLDRFPGDGFHFYENNGIGYCTFFIYGSGLPVIHHYTSEVIIEEEGLIRVSISLSKELNIEDNEEEVFNILLEYEDDVIKYDGREYDVLFEGNSLEFIDNK